MFSLDCKILVKLSLQKRGGGQEVVLSQFVHIVEQLVGLVDWVDRVLKQHEHYDEVDLIKMQLLSLECKWLCRTENELWILSLIGWISRF